MLVHLQDELVNSTSCSSMIAICSGLSSICSLNMITFRVKFCFEILLNLNLSLEPSVPPFSQLLTKYAVCCVSVPESKPSTIRIRLTTMFYEIIASSHENSIVSSGDEGTFQNE